MSLKVLVNWPVEASELAIIEASWPAGCSVVIGNKTAPEELLKIAPELDVIVGDVPAALLHKATRVRLLHVMGHGIDKLGTGEVAQIIRARGLPIARSNPASITLAEFVIMAMVALNRRVLKLHEALAYRGQWSRDLVARRLDGSLGGELYGASLLIAGMGGIGQEIGKRARAFGMRVGALTRRPASYDAAAHGLDFIGALAEPEPWLARADHLVLALPLTDETRNFLSAERFAAMKAGSFLINIGRSAMVDQTALVQALGSGRLAGAAIDVWPNEELRTYPSPTPIHHFNVIMTPHTSAITRESRVRAITLVGENLQRLMNGEPLLNLAGVDG